MLHPQKTINCKGSLLLLEKPAIMGVLNLTPDSFFDGGKYADLQSVLRQAEKMIQEGAAILDVGGVSTRPGAALPNLGTELSRVIPVVEALASRFPETILSIDTFRAAVARAAVEAGAGMVNDISAGKLDPDLYATVAELQVPYVLMHMQNTPATMQINPEYEDVVLEVTDFFIREIGVLRSLGVKDIILDPGFGFGKLPEHNFRLLQVLDGFAFLELPLLAGLSRKSMVYKTLGLTPAEALNGTTALNMVALQRGARLLRVHDVKEARETIALFEQLDRFDSW
jgi:dihydropteroate synthase